MNEIYCHIHASFNALTNLNILEAYNSDVVLGFFDNVLEPNTKGTRRTGPEDDESDSLMRVVIGSG